MEKKHKKISIIVPCYNCSEKIKRCLTSLSNQTSKDFEAIFIDDSSTDSTWNLLSKYQTSCNFEMIIKHNTSNIGPGFSRNVGIEISEGDFVMFLDSDDYFDENTILNLSRIIENDSYDVVVFDYKIRKGIYCSSQSSFINFQKEGDVETRDAIKFIRGTTWCKLYRKEVILKSDIRFLGIMRNEDLAFTKALLSYCSRIFYTKKCLYNYCIYSDSIMHLTSLSNFNNMEIAFEYISEKINRKYSKDISFLMLDEYLFTALKMVFSSSLGKNEKIAKWNSLLSNHTGWYDKEQVHKLSYDKRIMFYCLEEKHYSLLIYLLYLRNKAKKILR